jgi:hypothetical protein
MATCANCSNEAFFIYQVTDSYAIDFCSAHVPNFLRSEKYAASLITLDLPVITETTPVSQKKKSVETVVEETPAEDPESEDATN